jgi:carbamoyl-phosphate synthase large subunit
VLITSLSGKVPLIREVRKAQKKMDAEGRIIGADSNPDCIGRYFVDDFWEMPPIDKLEIGDLIGICEARPIRFIIPTRDGELSYFAKHRELLEGKGIGVMIASPEAVSVCLDKKAFFKVLDQKKQLNPIPTFTYADSRRADRWVVKERFGAGSKNILLNVSVKDAQSGSSRFKHPVFQPYIPGDEYSIDVYISRKGIPKGSIVRKRDVVIDGESQITSTVVRSDIEQICIEACKVIGLTEHVLFQIIEGPEQCLNILECNCRFGGASSLSVAAGLNSFYWFFRECLGEDLSDQPYVSGRQGLRQIRYAEDKLVQIN